MLTKWIYIGIGGAFGSLFRYYFSEYIQTKNTISLPLGTLSVNIIGSLLIGFLFGYFSVNNEINERLKLFVFIGFLGGFTTFSSFALENIKLMQNQQIITAFFYVILTNVLAISMAFVGYFVALKWK